MKIIKLLKFAYQEIIIDPGKYGCMRKCEYDSHEGMGCPVSTVS